MADDGRFHDGGAAKEERMLSSHRVVVNELNTLLDNHGDGFVWLDVGCGRGQVLREIGSVITSVGVGWIEYYGCDAARKYCDEASKQASESGFSAPDIRLKRVEDVREVFGELRADFVTIINVLHELTPASLAVTLVDSFSCLGDDGVLHVHDLRRMTEPELGAVCWDLPDLEEGLDPFLKLFHWRDSKCRIQRWGGVEAPDWSLKLERRKLQVDIDELASRREEIISDVNNGLMALLPNKRKKHHNKLNAFLSDPARTPGDRQSAAQAVYEYWTIGKWLE